MHRRSYNEMPRDACAVRNCPWEEEPTYALVATSGHRFGQPIGHVLTSAAIENMPASSGGQFNLAGVNLGRTCE